MQRNVVRLDRRRREFFEVSRDTTRAQLICGFRELGTGFLDSGSYATSPTS